MALSRNILIPLVFCLNLLFSHTGFSQSTEERFQDLFVTAGYSTAFGAAMGAAFLAFTDDPASKLSYVAMGASLGFIGGSILGTYMIFSPMVVDNHSTPAANDASLLASIPDKPRALAIRPVWNRQLNHVESLEAGWNIALF